MSANNEEFEQLLTPAQVAKALAVDSKTVTRWARAGIVKSITFPTGHRRFRRSDIDEILNGTRVEQEG